MKKIALLGLLALSMGFVACDEVEESNARPQENPQLPIFEAQGVNVVAATSSAEVVNLEGVANVAVGVVELNESFPEAYHVEAAVELSKDDFAHSSSFAAKAKENVLYADALEINAALREQTGLSPEAKSIKLRYALYAVNEATKARIGGPDVYFGPIDMTILPIDLGLSIEPAYYLVQNGDVENALRLNHSDLSPYDDPVFSASLNIRSMPYTWMIIPESSYKYAEAHEWTLPTAQNSQFGPEVEDGTEGSLIANQEGYDVTPGCNYDLAGEYLFTADMLNLEFGFKVTFPYLYTPGGSNSWTFGSSQVLGTDDFVTYAGFVNVDGEFKFTSEANWSAPYNLGLGSWTNDTPDADGWLSGLLENGSSQNVKVKENGLYYCSVEIASLMFKLYHVETIGIIGDATAGGWDASTALTPSANFLTWTGDVELEGGKAFKFRANDAWAVNLGIAKDNGSISNLLTNGENIPVAESGTYTITLDLSKLPYSCTMVKK